MEHYYGLLQNRHQLVAEKDRNAILFDWVASASAAANVPANPDWNVAVQHLPTRKERAGRQVHITTSGINTFSMDAGKFDHRE